MKKNLVAIETAAILVLIGLIIAGIILKIFTLIIIPICLLIIGILGIAIYKIIELKRNGDAKGNTNTMIKTERQQIFQIRKMLGSFPQ